MSGQANLIALAAPRRDDAWAGGFTIHDTSTARVAGQAARPGAGIRPGAGGAGCPFTGFLDSPMLHWTGHAWRQTAYPRPAARLQPQAVSVAAISPGDAWLAGATYDVTTEHSAGFIDRWNGRGWRRAAGPGSVSAVAGIPGGGVWVAGSTGDSTGETGDSQVLPLLARRF